MAHRALLAAVLTLLPSLALAQTGLVTVDPREVNRVECAGGGSVTVLWVYPAVNPTDTFRLAAASSCPTSAPAENGPLGPDLSRTAQSTSVTIASIQAAVSANCTSINDTTVKICVYYIAFGGTGTSTLIDGADFKFQTAEPPAPVNVSASPANQAIEVSYGAGTQAGNYQADTVTYKVDYAPQGSTTFTRTGETSSTTVRIGNLTNGTTYDARVVAFSSAGNEGPPSVTVSATPDDFLDFWSVYKDDGGREEGGCGAGGAGALAPLLLALAAFLRRRA